MTTHKTMCRWCGGEMEITPLPFSRFYWKCSKCLLFSDVFRTEAEALEWASQPIPFLNDGMNEMLSQQEAVFNKRITAALAVREEEE